MAVQPSTATARLRALDGHRSRLAQGRTTVRIRSRAGLSTAAGGTLFGAVARFGFGMNVPLLPVLAGMLAGGAAGVLVAGSAAARGRRRRDAALVESIGALAADLRAGRQPAEAMTADPAAAHLSSAAVAAVWTVAERSGAPAAAVLDRVEQDLRTRERQRREVTAQLAGARSTAALLAVLPVLGIGLGSAMGARPLSVLFGTGRGQAALLVGAGLDALGLLWTARIVATAGGER
ncbi:MAG: type II secretion system F family protein [Mycobacteriales bacterium]